MIPIVIDVLGAIPKGPEKKTRKTEDQRKNRDDTNHNIVKIS